ncbi:manganese-dependent inorganic pyrophosphatase [Lactiplantibacillus mudanjiangensis]|uniref:Probable manganese-dependent inorganic pyrophosphatase n=1 Tax=Lactiplantibacillus mudanjiangensis TaxID=1296538 RepID=A0A660E6U3_9LACO|nr:manganese-dependent inorganic pyrophosphatase [Lactiplantibacillus mudanjiangensis]VDG19413.1 manganese-dependent inorganic pyrophosphatase [Lactobacillus sp.] [Lactiplantibacillus mudanjiangensis]VDG25015.1 manganese-dependent inorganic pyrophosphatase [Lactobacillus sp.] [Lactiplantibacillus mudanjiangensis]VDG28005.1 manganese-dependent inorganic pyrophosphatase [Lactobacillus sp.] [Lactiplantibacillus mudanjiangensis]VDG30870.1 manganese-dependent inorganic pyrophosphatase [Lactobacillus
MSKELIFGHQSPDTDAIVAAKALSYLENKLGRDTEAVALGEPNEETKFVLDHFDEPAPRIIEKASAEVEDVMLVDHNEPQQSVSDIADVTVTHVVDHHRIANFNTAQPLFYRAEPLGCCSTVIYKMFKENNVEIPAKLAGLMLSAIISDTLLLKSPTTTQTDVDVVKDLAKISGTDYEAYGLDMLKAGTNLASKTETELIEADAKSFNLNGSTVRVAQVNTVDLAEVFDRQAAFEAAAKAENDANGYDLFLILATNILDSNSELLVVGAPTAPVEAAFGKKIENNRISLPGVVSRKKQVVPPLTDAFNA